MVLVDSKASLIRQQQPGKSGIAGGISWLYENLYTKTLGVPKVLIVLANINTVKKDVISFFQATSKIPVFSSIILNCKRETCRTNYARAWTR